MAKQHGPVLVGVDGSAANRAAVQYGASLAAARGVPLLLIAAVTGTADLPPALVDHPDEKSWDVLSEIAENARVDHPELEVRSRILFGDAVDNLVDIARGACVTVVGNRGLGRFSRILLGSVSAGVADRADGPVVVVPHEWVQAAHGDDDPVVVGVEAIGAAERHVLHWAFTEADRTGSPLHVVHALDPTRHLVWDPALVAAAYSDWEEGAAERINEEVAFLRSAFLGVDVRVFEERRSTADVLLDRSEEARLLVVGRRHHLALGSTERAVLHHTRVPVAVIPPLP